MVVANFNVILFRGVKANRCYLLKVLMVSQLARTLECELLNELGFFPLEAQRICCRPPRQGTCFCLLGRHTQTNLI